jgi:hypothetical protein
MGGEVDVNCNTSTSTTTSAKHAHLVHIIIVFLHRQFCFLHYKAICFDTKAMNWCLYSAFHISLEEKFKHFHLVIYVYIMSVLILCNTINASASEANGIEMYKV